MSSPKVNKGSKRKPGSGRGKPAVESIQVEQAESYGDDAPLVMFHGQGPRHNTKGVHVPIPNDLYEELDQRTIGSKGQVIAVLVAYALGKLKKEDKCLVVKPKLRDRYTPNTTFTSSEDNMNPNLDMQTQVDAILSALHETAAKIPSKKGVIALCVFRNQQDMDTWAPELAHIGCNTHQKIHEQALVQFDNDNIELRLILFEPEVYKEWLLETGRENSQDSRSLWAMEQAT